MHDPPKLIRLRLYMIDYPVYAGGILLPHICPAVIVLMFLVHIEAPAISMHVRLLWSASGLI